MAATTSSGPLEAGFWYAWPSTHVGYELVTAGIGQESAMSGWPVLTLSAGAEVVLETTGGGHCRRTDASNPNPGLSCSRFLHRSILQESTDVV